MNGLYFINERISIGGRTREESITLQEQSIKKYLAEQNIQVITLNPYQLKEHYTVPHALLYDLRQENTLFDCLIYYSMQAVEDFIFTYPAKWLILKSYFNEVIMIDQLNDWNQPYAI
ncbi:hypothetical protein V7266_08220 [Neobacillus drentensis]|uniref:hypothetical protein n=1 Tax=Neobacillus drentensis TaxID=220684 RepID=UPI002FFF8FB1